MSILFAVRDAGYPRNKMLRRMQQEMGIEAASVVEVEWQKGRVARLYALLRSGMKASKNCKTVFVAEFGLQFTILGWLIAKARGATLVVDHFVGAYETHVLDYGSVARRSLRGKYFRAVDTLAFWLADIATIDTEVRADNLAKRHPRANTVVVALPVGAPDWAKVRTAVGGVLESKPLRILYYGNYIPLHGVPYFVEALGQARDADFRVTLIGNSPDRELSRERLLELGLADRCTFLDPVPEEELANFIRLSHVVLGIFGTTYKARTVLANKVWQGLYGGRTVVTGASPALAEIQELVGSQLIGVDTSDPSSLASVVKRLAKRPSSNLRLPPIDRLDQHVRAGYEQLFSVLKTWNSESPRA